MFSNSLFNDSPLCEKFQRGKVKKIRINLSSLIYFTEFVPSLVSNVGKSFLEAVIMTFSPASLFNSFSNKYLCIDSYE